MGGEGGMNFTRVFTGAQAPYQRLHQEENVISLLQQTSAPEDSQETVLENPSLIHDRKSIVQSWEGLA